MHALPAPRHGAGRPQVMPRTPSDAGRARRDFAARLREEHVHLLGAIDGSLTARERERIGALVLLRVMVGYFLQRAGLLAGDADYLRHQLDRIRDEGDSPTSGGFYRRVLLPLFRAGGSIHECSDAWVTDAPIRLSPNLVKPLAACRAERDCADLGIADATFARLFAFCNAYSWQLDETQPAVGAITPAALSYVLAPGGARGHLGAHYTAADITGYIAANTIVPALLDSVRAACPAAFAPDGLVWRLLPEVPARSINDLVTANLDLVGFARDTVERCDDPALLLAFWRSLTKITILDPTCGTGAFLVGALRVLAPLYAACLRRMAEIESGGPASAFRAILDESERMDGARRFAARTIVTRNLYGVDLDDEAAMIARLRLLLAVCAGGAQAGHPADALSSREDIQLNVHTGDALVGRVRPDDTPPVGTTEPGGAERPWAGQLPHPPLHWPRVFPRVMRDRDGFDVVIGNPPYVRYQARGEADPLRGFRTRPAGNLYAMVVERGLDLLRPGGRLGMIVPIASVSTEGMATLQALYTGHPQWHSHFATRPAKLFPDVDMNLTITLIEKRTGEAPVFSTTYHRWRGADPAERASLFQQLAYVRVPPDVRRLPNPYPKIGSAAEVELLRRLLAHRHTLGEYVTADGTAIYYHSGGRYWRKALPTRLSSHYKELRVPARLAPMVGCLLSSQLFYWWWIVNSNCMDVVAREVVGLPVFDLDGADTSTFAALWSALQTALSEGAAPRRRRGARIATDEVNFDVARCKPIIDEIDRALATGYGFSAAQLDFIVSYDLRFRMGGAG